MLTERDWHPLPLELVLGKTWNCTWGVGLPHNETNEEVLLDPVLAYTVYGIISRADENTRSALVGHFFNAQIRDARNALWDHCGTTFIGEKPSR